MEEAMALSFQTAWYGHKGMDMKTKQKLPLCTCI